MDLIERVALNARIGAGRIWTEAFAEWAMQLDKDVGDQAAIQEIADGLESAARAAIAEMLDAMMERGPQLAEAIKYPGSKLAAADYWPFMLAQFRQEALGEG